MKIVDSVSVGKDARKYEWMLNAAWMKGSVTVWKNFELIFVIRLVVVIGVDFGRAEVNH